MFPDKIAGKTIPYLAGIIGKEHPYTDGTFECLKKVTKESGVDLSVALPVVTAPRQFASVNQFAAEHQCENILSFGGIHPDSEDYKGELRYIKELGLKGIKFHPDYQEVNFNDIRYKRIISYATELGLIIVTHAGMDPVSPDEIHCTPQMVAEVLHEVQPDKLVLAHMGGNQCFDDVERYLVGEKVYFDTGVVLDWMELDQCFRIIKNHGADKILFGTDMPWSGQKEYMEILKNMPLSEGELRLILGENAKKLLGI